MPVAQQRQSQESQTCTIETVDKAISVPEIEPFVTETASTCLESPRSLLHSVQLVRI